MNYENEIQVKQFYLGIEILRMFFAFIILYFHCMNREIYNHIFIKFITNIVSFGLYTFFFLSFYFSYNSINSKKINKIKERFKRLIIPYIIWPIIIYTEQKLFNYINGKENDGILFKFLVWQILIGNGIYLVFWFNFNLIFILLLFTIIIFLTKKYKIFLILFGLIIFFILSSNKYIQFWKGYNDIISFSLRPIASTYIQGLIGFYFSSINIIEKKLTKKYTFFCIFTLLLLLINNNNSIKTILKSLFSTFLILIFVSIPFKKLKIGIYIFIKQITRYTGGIYYIHIYTNIILKNYISVKYNSGTIFMCIIHYFLCYFICFIGSNLFKNNDLKYLFF